METDLKISKLAKTCIMEQSTALNLLANSIPDAFHLLIEYILQINGRVILMGMGKSGYIARKIAASLASTGTPAFYIHPSEASHGDLGMITEKDMVIMLSNSGETKELFDTINFCKRYGIKIAAITMKENSTLAQNSNFLLNLPSYAETSSVSAPTTSALMSLALGDAIVTTLHQLKGFTREDFKIFHPGGKIGTNLLKVSDIMKEGEDIPIVHEEDSFTNVILTMNAKCLGCAIVLGKSNKLLGIITDGDLRRHISENLANKSSKHVMTQNPKTVNPNTLASEALFLMNSKSITALPVVENSQVVGIIHIHDILKHGVA
ncbi:MAG: KpsF/GutQ family sugar-phosphate isomerase [Rickettsiales bacterium]|nr:KpsF/GutQ family sugar-phosphate isomerase [Rickettsiales bacterium]MCA0254557.1 KpsF/GutQ family sugar-phosphate isomerase [Pseudomonadota bacterium]